jgi:hypothetical protein
MPKNGRPEQHAPEDVADQGGLPATPHQLAANVGEGEQHNDLEEEGGNFLGRQGLDGVHETPLPGGTTAGTVAGSSTGRANAALADSPLWTRL